MKPLITVTHQKDRPPGCLSKLRHGHPLRGADARALARYLLQLADRQPRVRLATFQKRWLHRVCYGAPARDELPTERPLAGARKRLQTLELLAKEREGAKRIKDRAAVQRLDAQIAALLPKRKVYPLTHRRFMKILWYVQAGKTKEAQKRQATLRWTLGGGLSLIRPR
jgi:hypothetical protein